jgi:hypothetical protein
MLHRSPRHFFEFMRTVDLDEVVREVIERDGGAVFVGITVSRAWTQRQNRAEPYCRPLVCIETSLCKSQKKLRTEI